MWLLSTDRAELKFFDNPGSVPGGYAILSHVWDNAEQTFQDIQALRMQCANTPGTTPRDLASAKIRNFCILAEQHGYQWVWVDTCCIDKTSSSELSEAINSMYLYYSLAEVCYAYLRDVPTKCVLGDRSSEFGTSMWHKRGWTLQELVAPEVVVFLSTDWKILGTKADLAPLLESITHIPTRVLTLETELTEISVAARMSWAADRDTTRSEDEAYCLMGIFGIHMPTLYGEGQQAFRRLQEEIMKQSMDTSIFAWGYCRPGYSTSLIAPRYAIHDHADETYLLASSPSAFRECGDRHFTPPTHVVSDKSGNNPVAIGICDSAGTSLRQHDFDFAGIPTFTITPYGVLAHMPVIEDFDLTIAALFCTHGKQQLGLLLNRCPDAPDPARPLYHVCFRFSSGSPMKYGRLIDLGETAGKFKLKNQLVVPEWKSIYLAHRPPPAPPSRMLMNRSLHTPFRLPKWHLQELQLRLNVSVSTPANGPRRVPWTGSSTMAIHFTPSFSPAVDAENRRGFAVHLGRCADTAADVGRSGGPHWANVQLLPDHGADAASNASSHECSAHHIVDWTRQTKTFGTRGGSFGAVQLSFTPCPLNPTNTLVVNVKPIGWSLFARKEDH